MTTLVLLLAAMTSIGFRANGADISPASGSDENPGIAAAYPNDKGIAGAPEVVLADDFEHWANEAAPPAGTWEVKKNEVSRTLVVPGRTTRNDFTGPGNGVLEVACWTPGGGSQVGGLSLKLGNYNHRNEGLGDGYEELFIRYYIKFDPEYRAVRNHGANLGGRDVTRRDAAWVGMAAIRDVSSRGYFFSGVQPRGESGGDTLEIGFYSYHLDKRDQWGENYEVQRPIPIKVGEWHCVERHMKLNSIDPEKPDPANFDGMEELWIDGQLSIRKEGVRFRRVPNLRITYFTLETYYHGLPEQYGPGRPIKVCFDNVVIAKKYIGPIHRP